MPPPPSPVLTPEGRRYKGRHKGKMTTIDDFFGPRARGCLMKSKCYGVLGRLKWRLLDDMRTTPGRHGDDFWMTHRRLLDDGRTTPADNRRAAFGMWPDAFQPPAMAIPAALLPALTGAGWDSISSVGFPPPGSRYRPCSAAVNFLYRFKGIRECSKPSPNACLAPPTNDS